MTKDYNIQCIDSFMHRFPDYAKSFSETIVIMNNFVIDNTDEVNLHKGVYSI